jgi:type VI secretion system secreted protein Hcp
VNKLAIAGLSLLAAVTATMPAGAGTTAGSGDSVYVQVTGATQGGFSGDSANGGRLLVYHFDLSGIAPVDAASGLNTGKRKWNPIKFTKALDKSSAQFSKAFSTNERLSSVTFTVYGPARNADGSVSGGGATALLTVKLTNATIASDEIIAPSDKDPASGAAYPEAVENLAVTFTNITISYPGGVTNSDTWI